MACPSSASGGGGASWHSMAAARGVESNQPSLCKVHVYSETSALGAAAGLVSGRSGRGTQAGVLCAPLRAPWRPAGELATSASHKVPRWSSSRGLVPIARVCPFQGRPSRLWSLESHDNALFCRPWAQPQQQRSSSGGGGGGRSGACGGGSACRRSGCNDQGAAR